MDRRLPRSIWILGLVSLLMDVSSEMIHSLLPVFMVGTLGLSALTVGFIEGAAEATALVIKVFSGALSDFWGRRKPLTLLGYGLGAATKPLVAIASGAGLIVAARLIDRVGKGIRGAPRDALIADIAPADQRGAAFGLRQSLDTVGAFLGPLFAIALMLATQDNFQIVFWIAVIPAALAVLALALGVQEPDRPRTHRASNPIHLESLKQLPVAYWWVVGLGAMFTLARFSEAVLVLRIQQGGLPLALVPLVLVGMNVVYALSAYPFGKLADRLQHGTLLALGLVMLIAADLLLAQGNQGLAAWAGIALWGLHMGMTQGLLAAMIAENAPADLRGTAFGIFHLISGMAMLMASVVAGFLWDRYGAEFTFLAGIVFCALTLIVLGLRRSALRAQL